MALCKTAISPVQSCTKPSICLIYWFPRENKLCFPNYWLKNIWIREFNRKKYQKLNSNFYVNYFPTYYLIKHHQAIAERDNGAVKRIDMRYQLLSDFLIGSLLLALVQTQRSEWKTALPQSVTCHGCNYSKRIQDSFFKAIPVTWNMQYLWYSHTQSKQNWVEFSEVAHH